MESKKGQLYLGRLSDTDEPFLYKANTLTTHGVIVGMTGSGKTGLGVNLLEEALINGIPTLILDPKGDMGNIMLTFPDCTPEDFEPWIDEGKAARKGVTPGELAAATAAKRKAQLLEHGISPERMHRLKEGAEVTIYTPGSSAGVGLNVLGSLVAPSLDWGTQAEIIRDEIEGFVSSLLVLASVNSDPVSGPEHILLSRIIETWWRQGKDLDLATLIGQIPNPPFRKLGVFELDAFLPSKKRMALALQLNTLLASPSFASWLEGEPLSIERLIGESDKTKCAVVYMAHLTDQERQFMVTLLLSKLVTWIRGQPGSRELRALVYMDEAFGYAPPTAEPPSKKPIMTILKQARAFGVGLVLVTQNPVDLDYKAMSNAGTWIVGRLQTDNDKKRILEGMRSLPTSEAIINLDERISSLEKRQFIMHTAKHSSQTLFKRRRSMCFRPGPLTRDQVTFLMRDRKASTHDVAPIGAETAAKPNAAPVLVVAPAVAEGVDVVYLDPAAAWAGDIGVDPTGANLAPAVAATVQLLYDDNRAGVSHSETYEAVIYPIDGVVDVADVASVDHDDRDFKPEPPDAASYQETDVKLQNKTFWTGLQSDLKSYLVAHRKVEVMHCPPLKLYSRVGESEGEFRTRCQSAADGAADEAMAKLTDRYRARIERVKTQISSADARVRELSGVAAAKQQDELMMGAGDLLGALMGGRKSSNPLGKAASRRSASRKAHSRVESAESKLSAKQRDLADLEDELAESVAEIADEHDAMIDSFTSVTIGLERTDIRVADLKLVWVPVD